MGGGKTDIGLAHDVGYFALAAFQYWKSIEADSLVRKVLIGILRAHPGAGDVHSRFPGGHELLGVTVDRKSTRLNSSHVRISYAVFCLKKKNNKNCYCLHYVIYYEFERLRVETGDMY